MKKFSLGLILLLASTTANADGINCGLSLPCSDVIYDPSGTRVAALTDEIEPSLTIPVGMPVDELRIYLFTEAGSGTGPDAIVSDLVQAGIVANSLNFVSFINPDPMFSPVSAAEARFLNTNSNFKFTVVEETGTPHSLTDFNSNLAYTFASDVETISTTGVPGPIAGAGLPGLIFAGGVLLALARRRRQIA